MGMSDRKICRVGVIGGGHTACDFHLPGYVKHLNRLELVAGCDVLPQARERLEREFGFARTYADYNEMLDNEDLDVVGVFLVPEYNDTACRAVADRGVSILCEKPVATDYDTACGVVEYARECGVKFKTNMNYRFFHDAAQAKRDLGGGDLGAPYFLEFREYARWTPGTYGYARWDELEKSAEPFWGPTQGEQRYIWLPKAVHYVDLVRYLTGSEIASVYVQMGRHGGIEVPGEDFACATLVTESGVRALLLNHWSSHHSGPRGVCLTTETRIQCEDGAIHIASRDPYPEKGQYVVYRDDQEVRSTELSTDWSDSFAASMLELVSAIEEDREPLSNGEDYLRTQRVIEAGYESATTGEVAHLTWE
jgi:UDP-N-acetyl-2-amino-2-deoxyglucuronate dehydrogenase